MVSTGATIDALRDLVERASHENPHLTTRLEKAAFLVVLRQIQICGQNHYRVGSEDGLRDYVVIRGHCDCHDYVRHGPGHWCKHRLALSLYRSLSGDDSVCIEPSPLAGIVKATGTRNEAAFQPSEAVEDGDSVDSQG